jgi:hypothetical protein
VDSQSAGEEFIQLPIQWVLGLKWWGHEADNSTPSSAEVENVQICMTSHPCLVMVLNKAQDMSSWHVMWLSTGSLLSLISANDKYNLFCADGRF